MNRMSFGEELYDRDDAEYHMPYSRGETSGLFIFASLIGLVIVIAIIFIALYFTCTSPFGGSDKCKCTNSKGTWDDAKSPKCTCPAGTVFKDGVCSSCTSDQELVNGFCVTKCVSGQTRDSTGKCILPCPSGKVSNGLACVDDLTGNWLGYITSTNKSVPGYDWNIKHTTGGVAIYSGTTLKTTTVLDGTTIMWGTIKGTWDPLARRITWSNDSHWIKQT